MSDSTLTAVLYYDYLLTAADEVRLFWMRGTFPWPVILFYSCRYMALLGHIPIAYMAFATSDPIVSGIARSKV